MIVIFYFTGLLTNTSRQTFDLHKNYANYYYFRYYKNVFTDYMIKIISLGLSTVDI